MDYYIPVTLLVIIGTLAVGSYIKWKNKRKRYWEERGVLYASSLDTISSMRDLLRTPFHELLLNQYKDFGRIYGAYEFTNPVLTICEPDLLRDILVKDFHIFHFRRDMDTGSKIENKFVSILKGEDWKRVRTVISPAFTSRKMRQMSHIMNECSQTVIKNFRPYVEKGEPVNVREVFGAFTLDVIARSAFATKIDSLNDPENVFVKQAKKAFPDLTALRMLGFIILFLVPSWIRKFLSFSFMPSTNFFKDVILQVMKERRETGKKYDDILQLFMDAQDAPEEEISKENENSIGQEDEVDQYGSVTNNVIMQWKYKKLYEDELVAQCILFFVVGYETTASVLSYMAYSLALNPECQEKLLAEVDEASKKHEELNYDVIRDMKYLDCVVSETLRMYPSVVRSERTAAEDYKLGNTGIVIEKGTVIGFNIHAMHLDPELFQNPEKFDPERFLPENVNHHPYAYLPFGAGPRNCLGMRFALMEIKLCMCNILQQYRFKRAPTTKVPLQFKKSQGFLSVDELPLILEKRSK